MDNKIEGVEIADLVSQAASESLEEKRRTATGIIRKMFFKTEQLNKEIKADEKALTEKKKKQTETLEHIEKLKAGDWSILAKYSETKAQ